MVYGSKSKKLEKRAFPGKPQILYGPATGEVSWRIGDSPPCASEDHMWELLIPAAIVIWGVMMYNGLVRLREQADAAWADVDVQLKRRHDLIPNVVQTVKGYAGHERETLEAVIEARNMAMSATTPAVKGEAEGVLSGALKSLFALAEAYPDLKAAENFRDLQGTLGDLETTIANARRYYNAVVRDFNTRIHQVPARFVARPFGFSEKEYFEVPEEETGVPEVDFGA
jgi:LemA protein